jgi:ABC-2 type transport system permease protein
MSPISSTRPPPRRNAPHRLLGAQVGYQLRLLVRSPMAAFATLMFPLMVLLAVGLLSSGAHVHSRGGIPFAQFLTPAMVAFALVNVCYVSVISSTVLARDEGILQRLRSTPLPMWVYLGGRIVSAGAVSFVSAVVVVAVGAGVYDFQVVWSAIPAALLTLAVAMFCFCGLAFAVAALVPTVDSALPVAWGTLLPLCFISDVFEPVDNAPPWLRTVGAVFPVRPLADSLESVFNPVIGSQAVDWGHLAVLVAWGLGGVLFAALAFRWEPSATRRHGTRSTIRAALATCLTRARDALGAQAAAPAAGSPELIATPQGPRDLDDAGSLEWIEGPAPGEDSSIPPEVLSLPDGEDRVSATS